MSKYTTGELAKLCGVTVRTVQFYDTKGLLKPSELTDGGRRLYSEEDVKRLQLICLLKSLGLSLDSVKGVLESDNAGKILNVLLEQQKCILEEEIRERKKQLETIRIVREDIANEGRLSVNSISDIEEKMNDRQKRNHYYGIMFTAGILMDAAWISTLVFAIMQGIWWPFAAALMAVIITGVIMVNMVYKNVMYICPECNEKFKPKFWEFFFAGHTPRTRKLTCTCCSHKSWCIEVFTVKSVKGGVR